MIKQPRECRLRKMINTIKRCSDAGERFCFILGAGASISSGIDSGAKMAQDWLKALKEYEPEATQKWIRENNVDENDIGSHYSQLYEMRFNAHPLDGYIWLQEHMKKASPGLGYYHLANILAADNAPVNLVITTNFDSLTEDAIFMYTSEKPMVVTHELLAQYVDFFANSPIIAKIHRDLLLRPKNSEDETRKLEEAWEPVLKKAFDIYSPIVIGYGGNDESLMSLLKTVFKDSSREKPIYWCYRRENPPINENIIELLNQCDGFLIPINDFDETMYLFGEEFGNSFNEKTLVNQLQARIDAYKEKRKKIDEELRKEQTHRELTDDEKAVINAISESQKNELNELTEKINKTPKLPWSYKQRGDYYLDLKEYNKAVDDYTKAIEFDPTTAVYYYNRGAAYNWLNEYEKAADDYTKAIEIDPTNSDYYFYRMVAYNYQRQNEKSAADVSKAMELDPNNAYYYAQNAVLLYRIGETDKAFKNLEKALLLDATLPDYYAQQGWINLKIAKKNI